MKPREYKTPEAFKAAVDERLRRVAGPGPAITRRRQLLIFDRYLARIGETFGDAAVLKGGLVLEVRLERARTTRDIDLRVSGSVAALLERLQQAGRLDLGDFMRFEVRVDTRHPDIAGPGIQYAGQRFRAECRMAGGLYGQAFGVDVAIGDPVLGSPERVPGDDLLAFAGIAAPELLLYPVETHVAEKLHAYTLPRPTPSTRVKDLPDLALLGQAGSRTGLRLREAIDLTFGHRGTHSVSNPVSPTCNISRPLGFFSNPSGLLHSGAQLRRAVLRKHSPFRRGPATHVGRRLSPSTGLLWRREDRVAASHGDESGTGPAPTHFSSLRSTP